MCDWSFCWETTCLTSVSNYLYLLYLIYPVFSATISAATRGVSYHLVSTNTSRAQQRRTYGCCSTGPLLLLVADSFLGLLGRMRGTSYQVDPAGGRWDGFFRRRRWLQAFQPANFMPKCALSSMTGCVLHLRLQVGLIVSVARKVILCGDAI